MNPSGSGGDAATTGRGGTAGGGSGVGGTTGAAGTTGGATAGAGGSAVGGMTGGAAGTTAGVAGGAGGPAGATGNGGKGGASAGSGGAGSGGSAGGAGAGNGGRGGASGSAGSGNAGRGGGAGTAAGGASGSGTGGTAGAGNPCATRAGLLFCDDFEGKAAGAFATAAPWVLQGGNVTIDGTTPAHSGSKSVHVHAGDNDYDTLFVLHDATILPAPNGKFFLRAYMRLSRAMAGGHNAFIIADPYAMQGTGNNLRIGEMNAMLMYTIMGDGHGALSNQNFYNDGKAGVAFTPSTWVCLEALIDHGHPEIDIWVDGTEVPDLHHTDWALDSYDSVRFGFEKYAGPGIDIWYDDIAVGTQRIGCN
ncbi:MAG TPA: hypothetical protein VIF57_09765 [Polyangia bacterium]